MKLNKIEIEMKLFECDMFVLPVRVWSCVHNHRTTWKRSVHTDNQPDAHSCGESHTREQVWNNDYSMSYNPFSIQFQNNWQV